MEKQFMIKSFEVIRPIDFPYRLISFTFFFNNVNTHIMNMHHAAGIDLIYEQVRMCYLFPQNEFYELLRLQNNREPHDSKYDWILMKGIFGGEPAFEATLHVENARDVLNSIQPAKELNGMTLALYRLPEPENDMVIREQGEAMVFHHLQCSNVLLTEVEKRPVINTIYFSSYSDLRQIINSWLTEEHKEMIITENLIKQ